VKSKVCYHCQEDKPLSEYRETFKKAARPEWKGRCIGCKDCTDHDVARARMLAKYPAHGRWVLKKS